MHHLRILAILLALGGLTACGDDEGDDHGNHTHDDAGPGKSGSGGKAGGGGKGGATGSSGKGGSGGAGGSQPQKLERPGALPRPPSGSLPAELRPPR